MLEALETVGLRLRLNLALPMTMSMIRPFQEADLHPVAFRVLLLHVALVTADCYTVRCPKGRLC